MIAEKEKTAASTAAIRNKQHSRAYPKAVPLSSLKVQIGELLLLLLIENGQPDAWLQFERLLRQFYKGVFCERKAKTMDC